MWRVAIFVAIFVAVCVASCYAIFVASFCECGELLYLLLFVLRAISVVSCCV